MKVTITKKTDVQIDVATLVIDIPVDDDDMPKDFPGLSQHGTMWHAEVDLDSMKIKNHEWPNTYSVYVKACDSGCYQLVDRDGVEVASIVNDYVPRCLGDYGDYLCAQIQPDGRVDFAKPLDFQEWFEERE